MARRTSKPASTPLTVENVSWGLPVKVAAGREKGLTGIASIWGADGVYIELKNDEELAGPFPFELLVTGEVSSWL